MLLAKASSVLSNSLGASMIPAWNSRSTALSSACCTHSRCAPRMAAGRLQGAGEIGVEVGKVITRYKTGKHFTVTPLAVTRRQDQIDAEAALDGFHVLRTPVPPPSCGPPPPWSPPTRTSNTSSGTSATSKPTTWTCGPVFHRLEERVRAHVLICLLACYLTWHLRRAWAPLRSEENTSE